MNNFAAISRRRHCHTQTYITTSENRLSTVVLFSEINEIYRPDTIQTNFSKRLEYVQKRTFNNNKSTTNYQLNKVYAKSSSGETGEKTSCKHSAEAPCNRVCGLRTVREPIRF